MKDRRRRRGYARWLLFFPLVLAWVPGARGLAAQGTGAMLFSYEPHEGQRASFDEGYRSHLEWHRANRDSLAWYGWDVVAGRRLGQFVDGTFGIAFAALDRRVDPAGDGAHASRSFAPHARATGRWAVRLRRELSTATPLEDRSSPGLAQVVTYRVPPGLAGRFAEVLQGVRERAGEADLLPYTVYETVVGGSDAGFTLMVWRSAFAGFDRTERDPAAAIRRSLSGELSAALHAESELWQLRQDLTLLPGAGAGTGGAVEGADAARADAAGAPPAARTTLGEREAARAAAESGSWQTVRPGGATTCGFGDPFEFWVREGSSAELLVYLQGGGACWTHGTCHPEAAIQFDAAVTPADHAQRVHGIFDASNPDNAFGDATVVFVPYCTGDFHLGGRSVTYDPPSGSELAPVTVHHAGHENVSAVLVHLATRPAAPSRITVVGASAGAVAAPVVAARLAARFPRAVVRQIGDGAAGLRFPGARELLRHWGADAALAADGFVVPDSGDAFAALYRLAAAQQPRIRFAQVATADDARIAAGLRLIGEDPASVRTRIEETYAELDAAGICFSAYLLPGTEHTIVWRPGFYAAQVDGEPLARRIREEVLERPCGAR